MDRSKEHNEKISKSMQGHPVSLETRKKMAESHRKYKKINILEYLLSESWVDALLINSDSELIKESEEEEKKNEER